MTVQGTVQAHLDISHVSCFYIGGDWVAPAGSEEIPVINPATEQTLWSTAAGTSAEVDRAVSAAQRAFPSFSGLGLADRAALLDAVVDAYKQRSSDLAAAVSLEMGAPSRLARDVHVKIGLQHFQIARKTLDDFEFDEDRPGVRVRWQPIGVCGLITPWNWPLNQMAAKLAPALATGCTMVLKPSELAPLTATILAEALDAAGVPKGVFNMVHGSGPVVGRALAEHPHVNMISITGSTRAGIDVARSAAATVKRVVQELGGKSASIVLDDADVERAVEQDVAAACRNSGQSCNACARILVPAGQLDAAIAGARKAVGHLTVGPPESDSDLGPLVSAAQYEKVQGMIQRATEDGARVVAGGPGRPADLERGYYVRPTVLADVRNDMEIAQVETFGPVTTLITYTDEDEAVRIANDSSYGLSGRVWSTDSGRAQRVAGRMQTGMVHVNGATLERSAPFGGYKMSGNGREYGAHGFYEFLEAKSIYV